MAGEVVGLAARLRARRDAISSGDPTGGAAGRNPREVRKAVAPDSDADVLSRGGKQLSTAERKRKIALLEKQIKDLS